MSKADTIDALMESAIHCFSRYGYEGASLRDIAANAGVPLSTIHMYFGSKAELYTAIERKSWGEIDDERSALLSEALAKAGARPPELADLIHALARPVVRRMLGASEHDQERIFIIRGRVSDRRAQESPSFLEVADRSVVRWIDAIQLACPSLVRQDIVWAFSFVVGAIYSWQLVDHRYDQLLGQDIQRTVDGITGDIVTFGCAGIHALIERRRLAAQETSAA
ncbi:MAG: TetR/AcrR family transcriptional regulator [Phenylobacterium sp.]|uniref:TetR/AcrR family transcriptional regulator n=1 Tax=Phenylobacterium sp. TaxID=1871053 RepID=UPI0012006F00|nr:TetR/AcrR family transcriptional regulator [Phenylobacterium sp.]TAJ74704.1 MAG: TetR/AcrR family transcriptional regulator [Phenylobacterium sp.]